MSRWRVIAFAVAAIAIIAIGLRVSGSTLGPAGRISRAWTITGLITGDDATVKLIREIADFEGRRGPDRINSPGGTTDGAEDRL